MPFGNKVGKMKGGQRGAPTSKAAAAAAATTKRRTVVPKPARRSHDDEASAAAARAAAALKRAAPIMPSSTPSESSNVTRTIMASMTADGRFIDEQTGEPVPSLAEQYKMLRQMNSANAGAGADDDDDGDDDEGGGYGHGHGHGGGDSAGGEGDFDPRTVNNVKGLKKTLREMSISEGAPWGETLVVTSEAPNKVERIDDDQERELTFYAQALDAVKRGFALCEQYQIKIRRPEDYFAEMVKSDEHLHRIQQNLSVEKKKLHAVEYVAKQRQNKKFGKKVQHEKELEKMKQKKEHMDKLKKWRSVRKDKEDDAKDFAIELEKNFGESKPAPKQALSKRKRPAGALPPGAIPTMDKWARTDPTLEHNDGRRSKGPGKKSTADDFIALPRQGKSRGKGEEDFHLSDTHSKAPKRGIKEKPSGKSGYGGGKKFSKKPPTAAAKSPNTGGRRLGVKSKRPNPATRKKLGAKKH
ncbi:rRNA processing protein Ebp2 [Pelomyxa schiedti]|nr:rRNA processing protein Ebp2 [Pelomyxa schiedti]